MIKYVTADNELSVSYMSGHGIKGCLLNVSRHTYTVGDDGRKKGHIERIIADMPFASADDAELYAAERGYIVEYVSCLSS